MTDEMRIQQRPSALPYMLGGAAVGAGAGWAVDKYMMTKPMTHEDVIAEVNSKDKLELRTKEGAPEAAGWKDVQEKAQAVKDAEAKVENAKKPVLPESAIERDNLKKAEQAYEAEIKRLTTEETTRLQNASKTTATEFKILTPDEAKSALDVKTLKRYDTLYNNYQKELAKAQKAAGRPEALAIEKFQNTTMADLNKIYSASNTTTASWRRMLGSKNTTSDKQVAKAVKQLRANIDAIIPLNIPSDKELANRGVDIKDKAAKKAYIQKLTDRVNAQRQSMLDEILGKETRVAVYDTKGNLVRERLSYENVETYRKAVDKKLKAIKKINSSATLSAADKTKQIADANKRFADQMNAYFGGISHTQKLNADLDRAIINDSNVQTARNNLKSFVYGPGHENLKELATETVEKSSLTADEIATQAKAYAEKNIKPSFQEEVTKMKGLLEEAASKTGEIDKEALKAAEGELTTARGELEKAAKSLGEKFTKGGNKWLAIGIGAAALGLGALALRPSAKEA